MRVAEVPAEADLVGTSKQKLSIKIEIDTRPPAGAATEAETIPRHFLFALRHHDLPSLMAGNVHALIARPYSKGKDYLHLLNTGDLDVLATVVLTHATFGTDHISCDCKHSYALADKRPSWMSRQTMLDFAENTNRLANNNAGERYRRQLTDQDGRRQIAVLARPVRLSAR